MKKFGDDPLFASRNHCKEWVATTVEYLSVPKIAKHFVLIGVYIGNFEF